MSNVIDLNVYKELKGPNHWLVVRIQGTEYYGSLQGGGNTYSWIVMLNGPKQGKTVKLKYNKIERFPDFKDYKKLID